ncbi:MAG: hypothetical protein AB1765_01485 [Candidatus Hydrogenedentota bacterium]
MITSKKTATIFISIIIVLSLLPSLLSAAGELELISVTSETNAVVYGLTGVQIVLTAQNTGTQAVNKIDTPLLRLIQND